MLTTLARSLAFEPTTAAELKEAQKKVFKATGLYQRLAKEMPELYEGPYAYAEYVFADILKARGKKVRAMVMYESAAERFARANDPFFDSVARHVATIVAEAT